MIYLEFKWDLKQAIDKATITLHPDNKKYASKITRSFNFKDQVEVINAKNERRLKIDISQIYLIEAMDHLSKLYTVNNQVYYIRGRLKDLEKLALKNLMRINNSTILNMDQVTEFKKATYARIEVHTKNAESFIVSRHYAKKVKEGLI